MTRAFQKPLGVLAYYWSEGDDSDLKLFENERSARNAAKSGFIPAWVEMTVKPADVVDEMNS